MKKRYERNFSMLSEEEFQVIRNSRVCVVGCGGLGGYVIEFFARLGIGHITCIDGDVFDESNLNRQILSTEINMGVPKAEAAETRVKSINSDVSVNHIKTFLDEENVEDLIKGHNIVIDALDSIPARLILEEGCKRQGIPLVHGAIAGWYGQVMVVYPEDTGFEKIYHKDDTKGVEVHLGNPSFTPAIVAGIQVAEGLKVILNRGEILRNKMLIIDLLNLDYEVI